VTGRAVVDTNVLVAANGWDTHVDMVCQLSCVEELSRMRREEVVCVDDKGLIMREYERRTAHKGQARPGTVFYKHVWQQMGDSSRIRLISVEPRDAEGRDFRDPVLPANNLKKDAKFLAVAVKGNAAIVNAADSDWAEHRDLTDRLEVQVRQLCPQHATRS
jgi:predicted nucleic acid-binding protein